LAAAGMLPHVDSDAEGIDLNNKLRGKFALQ
jgi:hypothetical protein